MTLTLEEISGFMVKGSTVRDADLSNKRPIILKHVGAKRFLKLLKINQIEKESLKMGGSRWTFNTIDTAKGMDSRTIETS